jgi:hypothetical protein
MASDFNRAGITVSHNLYILRSIVDDLVQGWYRDPHEHRMIVASKADLEYADTYIRGLIAQINAADTSRDVARP